jgi:hypothetical protein
LIRKYSKTNLFIIDEELWKWAKYRASILGFNSVSEYIFELIRKDRKSTEEMEKTKSN